MAGRPLKIFIYTLNCPITGLVRYVGKTKNDAAKAIGRSSRRIQMMVTGTGKKVNQVGGYCFSMGYKLENIE